MRRSASFPLVASTSHGLFLLVLVASIACTQSSTPPTAPKAVAQYDPNSGKLQRLEMDVNKNGKLDTFSYWDSGRVLRIEIDKDEDGKIDRWEHYGAGNTLERVGSSSKDDQIEDTWAYPDDHGFLARVETDSNRDGVIDKREIFVPREGTADGRALSVVELELDKDGKPHRRLHYRVDGSFERSEQVH